MARRTRQGAVFSPFEMLSAPADFTPRNNRVVCADVDLHELLAAAQAAADAREEGGVVGDDPSDWEDVYSRPPSPLTRSPSPQCIQATQTAAQFDSRPSSPIATELPPLIESKPQGQAARKKLYNKLRRQRKRQEEAASPFTRGSHPQSFPDHRLLPSHASNFDAADFKSSGGGAWMGSKPLGSKRTRVRGRHTNCVSEHLKALRLRKLEELKEMGYTYIAWDGKNPLLIVDREHRIICAFLGTPEDPDWPSVVARAGEALKQAREEGLSVGAFAAADKCHRRGKFLSLAGGLSHGGGQKKPGMIVLSRHQRRLFQNLLKNKDVRRICGFQSSGFRTFGPKMFKQYVLALKPLFEHLPELEHIFTNSVYPAITFNLGPDSVTFEHLDFNNNPFGWCGITSAGDFDAKRGAHIHLKQLKLVVEFPSGASTLIPSAVVDHGNTPLGSGETRYSITQYAAGGLFRFVQYGMKTAKELMAQEEGAGMKNMVDGAPGERAQWGVDLFSKEDELAADHAAVFGDMHF